jgi:hypothetical protein
MNEQFRARIEGLKQDLKEEDPNASINAVSLKTFEYFVTEQDFDDWAVSLTPYNTIVCSLRLGNSQFISLHFLDDGQISLIIRATSMVANLEAIIEWVLKNLARVNKWIRTG